MTRIISIAISRASGLVIRTALAIVVVSVWFMKSGTLTTYIEWLREWPMFYILRGIRWFVRDVWNPIVAPHYPWLGFDENVLLNLSTVLGGGQTLLLPTILIAIYVVGAIIHALFSWIFRANEPRGR